MRTEMPTDALAAEPWHPGTRARRWVHGRAPDGRRHRDRPTEPMNDGIGRDLVLRPRLVQLGRLPKHVDFAAAASVIEVEAGRESQLESPVSVEVVRGQVDVLSCCRDRILPQSGFWYQTTRFLLVDSTRTSGFRSPSTSATAA